MSDIDIRCDGLLTFLVAAGLGSVLLLAAAGCFLRGWGKTKRLSASFASPNLCGMLLSATGFAATALVILMRDGGADSHTLERWLNRWVVAWGVAVLLVWPLTSYLSRRSGAT